jgi:hypothetical protein
MSIRLSPLPILLPVLMAACDQPAPPAALPVEPMAQMDMVTLPSADLARLRDTTRAFRSIAAAEAAGYTAFGGCFSDPVLGGMGFHYANAALMADSSIDALRPELMVYEPLPAGELRLAAVEYIVFQDEWHAKGHRDRPRLFGQEFHLNTTLLAKPFYLLHAWVWRDNPEGNFVDWNPRVQCR